MTMEDCAISVDFNNEDSVSNTNYDPQIYNVLVKFDQTAASLYIAMKQLLQQDIPCKSMLVAHCMREILSLIARGDSWMKLIKEVAQNLDNEKVPIKSTYYENIEKLILSYKEKHSQKKRIAASLLEHNKSITPEMANNFADKLKALNLPDYAHNFKKYDQSSEFNECIDVFCFLIRLIGSSFYEDRTSIQKLLSQNITNDNLEKIFFHLKNPAMQYEFYGTMIADDENWFNILQDNGIFNFSNFQDKIIEDETTIQLVWGPFYYLSKIFTKIPEKVMPIFADITKKHITKDNYDLSWYVLQILQIISDNLSDKISIPALKNVLKPFTIRCTHKGSFYTTDSLFKILDYLISKKEERFVIQLLTSLLCINGKIDDNKRVKFYSWQDYYYLIQRINESGFIRKHPNLSFKVFTYILKNAYSDYSSVEYQSDCFAIDYIINQDITCFEADLVVIRQLISLAEKTSQEELHTVYNELRSLREHQIIKSILCYFATQNKNDIENAYKFLFEFADELPNIYFGTSDYSLLALNTFGKLSDEQKDEILNKRECAFKKRLSEQKDNQNKEIIEQVIRWFFIPFKNNLPQKWQEKYGKALEDIDPKEYIQRNGFKFKMYSDDISDISEEDMKGKSLSELINIINEMVQKQDLSFEYRSKIRGTTKLIAQYVNNSKDMLKDFKQLEDNKLALGIHNDILWKISFSEPITLETNQIKSFLGYLGWVNELPEHPENIIGKDIYFVEDCTSLYIASNNIINNTLLYVSGFDEEDYKVILDILLNNLTKEDKQSIKMDNDRDYYELAINSLWGTTLIALIRLGLKANELNNEEILKQVKDKILELLPQQNKIIYSVLGRYYPWMQYIVGDKLSDLRNAIFNKTDKELFAASFGAYLHNHLLYLIIFEELKEFYLYAAQNDMFIKDDNLSYVGDTLGDHLGILLYKQMITKEDDLGKALLGNPQLLSRAIWWIISSLVHDKVKDIDFIQIKDILWLVATYNALCKDSRYKGVFNSYSMLLESKYFEGNEEWMINTAKHLFEIECIDHQFYGKKVYENFIKAAHKEELKEKIIEFLKAYLIKSEYKDNCSPISSKCPYYLHNNEINQIFETLLRYNLTSVQKDTLYNIFNELSNYGFYRNIEKYIEQIKE